MSLLQALTSRMAGTKTYVDDVFSAYTYTGNGSTQTINNGIDLAGKGGMVWIKKRGGGIGDHHLYDTVRGATNMISSNTTGGTIVRSTGLTAFNSNGFSIGAYSEINGSGDTQVSWTFRKAPKFFDVVTYTGNGGTKVVPHSIGSAPGMIVVKRTDTTGDWVVYHQSVPANCGFLNLTNSFASAQRFSSVTSSDFTINVSTADVNASGGTYVAYLFAHDTSTDGIIQCGSFTTDGSGNATVNLGWEPQYVKRKKTTSTDNWEIIDSMRGMPVGGDEQQLQANLSNAETASGNRVTPNATGFTAALSASSTYIYLAIRRPNKPPTSGTQVYNAIARTGTGAAATVTGVGFAPDLVIGKPRDAVNPSAFYDRLRGAAKSLQSTNTNSEATYANSVTAFNMDGVSLGVDTTEYSFNWAGHPIINHFFRRAPGVFDVVNFVAPAYNTTGTFNHGLGVEPELIFTKNRSISDPWSVYAKPLGTGVGLRLNTSGAAASDAATYRIRATPTTSSFSYFSPYSGMQTPTIAYLFATLAGISKVGSYTGNGSSQTINCGFTTGARFILIKRTDFTGNWFVWDSVRGIVAGNDPHLSLNTTAAEVTTDDSIDPDTSGFIVNQDAATNINVNAATYIYLSLA